MPAEGAEPSFGKGRRRLTVLSSSHSVDIDSLAFYSTSAQVIPVLFIVLAIEVLGRIDQAPEADVWIAAIRLLAFALIAWGEWQALSVLSTGRDTATAHEAVTMALVSEALVLSLEPLSAFARSLSQAIPWVLRPYASLVRRGSLVIVGLALGVLGVVQFIRSL